jgi:hypothetical protein
MSDEQSTPDPKVPVDIQPHPIAQAIETYILRICDLRRNAFKLLAIAAKSIIEEFEMNESTISSNAKVLDTESSADKIIAINNILESQKTLRRLNAKIQENTGKYRDTSRIVNYFLSFGETSLVWRYLSAKFIFQFRKEAFASQRVSVWIMGRYDTGDSQHEKFPH